ncbi:unnamed protein product [Ectocarpus sp. CCAP 1310/34]|nr:unnamed protein product [Ectocarpus sp. CCAP 1310/34]
MPQNAPMPQSNVIQLTSLPLS